MNAVKSDYTLNELGWTLHKGGSWADWDGLTEWFMKQAEVRSEVQQDGVLTSWLAAAEAVLPKLRVLTCGSRPVPHRRSFALSRRLRAEG